MSHMTPEQARLHQELEMKRVYQDPRALSDAASQHASAQQAANVQAQALQAPHAPEQTQQAQPPPQMPKNIHDIAEKILVQQDQAKGEARVHIKVNDSILPGTEIKLHRQQGRLSVVIETSSPLTHNILGNQVQNLQAYLSKNSAQDVHVQLDYQTQTQEQGDSQQQSQQRERAEDYYRDNS